eukprot:3313265-Rhodomonas_salina.1
MGMGALAASVSECKNLLQLQVDRIRRRRRGTTGDAGHMLAAIIAACRSIQTIEATENQIGDGGATSIAAVM